MKAFLASHVDCSDPSTYWTVTEQDEFDADTATHG